MSKRELPVLGGKLIQTIYLNKILGTNLLKGLGCIMPLSTIFQLYHGGQFYWWRKLEYLKQN
jgi:hypothetical protein